jgi:hypothetical protein
MAAGNMKITETVPLHVMEALEGRGDIAPTHDLGTRWGEWSASRPGRKDPRYPLYKRLGGPQSRSEHRG